MLAGLNLSGERETRKTAFMPVLNSSMCPQVSEFRPASSFMHTPGSVLLQVRSVILLSIGDVMPVRSPTSEGQIPGSRMGAAPLLEQATSFIQGPTRPLLEQSSPTSGHDSPAYGGVSGFVLSDLNL